MNRIEKIAVILPTIMELLESDDEENILEVAALDKHLKVPKNRISIENYVREVALMYTPDDFKSHFRVSRNTFEELLQMLGPYLQKKTTEIGRPTMEPEKQLLVLLSMLSNQDVFRNISEKYNIAKSTAWLYVHKICTVLVKLAENYITWPSGARAIQTMADFKERQGFPNVMGAMDGTHIPITPPKQQQASYCNRKRYHSIILQAVCDSNYMFTDVFAGYPGSVHDARVFRNSDLCKKIEDNPDLMLPHDSHILADSAYRNSNNVLTPYRDNGHLTRVQKSYNYKHSSTRIFIEQTFGLLKGRFRILKHVNIYNTELIPPLIVACCVLHNVCMQRGDDVEPYLDPDQEIFQVPYEGNDNTGLSKRNTIANVLYTR